MQPENLNCVIIFCSHQEQQHFKSIAISTSSLPMWWSMQLWSEKKVEAAQSKEEK